MVLEIPDPNTPSGLQFLDAHLSGRSYISGYEASSADADVFRALRSEPKAEVAEHAARWYRHLKALDRKALPASEEKVSVEVPQAKDGGDGSKVV